MKKNKAMRLASLLLILTLLSTSVISGTFAKYTSSASVEDTARVAYWGFGQNTDVEFDLFLASYDKDAQDATVVSVVGDVIAPGTSGSADFAFKFTDNTTELTSAITAPEVDYTFDVAVVSNCDQLIKDNKNIKWILDGITYNTWDEFVDAIDALGAYPNNATKYEAGTLPNGFGTDDVHTIAWIWEYAGGNNVYPVAGQIGTGTDGKLTQDEYDTYMGNQADLDDVSITITITATQLN